MFGIGSTELIVILIVALIILGPKKLPEIARSVGKALGEFRRAATDVKRTIEREAEQAESKEVAEKKGQSPEKKTEELETEKKQSIRTEASNNQEKATQNE